MNGQDQSNTGETRWFGTDGRELTAKEYLRLLAKTQQTGTGAAEPEEQPPSSPAMTQEKEVKTHDR